VLPSQRHRRERRSDHPLAQAVAPAVARRVAARPSMRSPQESATVSPEPPTAHAFRWPSMYWLHSWRPRDGSLRHELTTNCRRQKRKSRQLPYSSTSQGWVCPAPRLTGDAALWMGWFLGKRCDGGEGDMRAGRGGAVLCAGRGSLQRSHCLAADGTNVMHTRSGAYVFPCGLRQLQRAGGY
jgi:hypothetical protein